jgi:hypothetical protein
MSNLSSAANDPGPRAQPDFGENEPGTGGRRTWMIVGGVIVALLLIAALYLIITWLVQNPDSTRNIRDIFIILLALMSTLVVLALVILVALVARLVLMLQNEIQPLLLKIDETVSTLRGTTAFMSETMVDPVVKAASYAAGARRFMQVLTDLRPRRRRP